MANKLEIGVTADTGDAQKGIKDLEKDIEGLGKAAENASDKAAKSTSQWSDSLGGVKTNLPTPADAKGITAIGDASIVASKSTAIMETRLQRLGRVLRGFGTTLAAGFSRAFSGLARTGLAAGRMLGTALMTGLKLTAVGAIIALGATIHQQFQKLYDKIVGAGEAAAESIRKAFAAGLEVEQFRAFEGLGQALGLTAEAAEDFASSMGGLQTLLKEGGEPAKQLAEAVRLLGGDLKSLDPTNAESMANFLASIQSSYRELAPLARQKLLSLMFEGADMATLAEIDSKLMGAAINVGKLAAEIDKYQKSAAAADKQNAAMASAMDKLTTAGTNLWNAWLEVTRIGPAFEQAWRDLPKIVEAFANHVNTAAEALRALPGKVQQVATEAVAAFNQMFDQLVAAAVAGWNAVWNAALNAVNAGIAKVKAAVQSFVDWFADKMKAMNAAAAGAEIGGMVPQGNQRQSVPMPFSGGMSGLRTAGAPYANPYSNFAGRQRGVTTFAANDNSFGGLVATMDAVLFRWEEYSKEVEKAASTTERAGATISNVMTQASASTEKLASSADVANDNFMMLDDTAMSINDSFAAWGQQAVESFIDAAIAGEDLRDVLAGLLKDLAKLILQQYVLEPLFGGLFGSGGLFSAGAPLGLNADAMNAGGAGLRALSAADVSGLANIAGRTASSTPAGDTSVTNNVGDINIDMQSSAVTASTEDGKRLGQQIEKAVQAVLIRESKPGGILRQVA
ncbi:hypothetical protein [Sinorhizobium fredii]|uniref:hypothetical protein n=1 Tax=Rhizobium fredii TaxID=380 RepID=UPI0004B6F759|nr:hypothetical protein [Sinorhizobium fredii]